MDDSKNIPDDGMDIIIEADKQAEIFHRFISLAEKISPRLWADGANFNLWSKNMLMSWTTYFMGDLDYFQQSAEDNNIKQKLVAKLFIQHSVEHDAYEAITSCVHGSDLIVHHGKIDSEMITTLAIFFAVPSIHQHITPAINTLMATNPNLKVRPDDLLNMIQQIATASPSFDHSTEIA
ncbi:hypothetical protein O181_022283 [Austropuccinia psidii MF-1]|uniref:Uncharacterized protein n=1 Tax=Austropuccinia psidii MF-1 TaxID=1389203 RepID=A0A9Q3CEW7_9BASI|nr:hypothetical protein [Austropuccinia psidii MF-1]